MNDLLKQLKDLGFSNEYLISIENQNFDEILPQEDYEVEYMVYDSPVEYMTKSTLENLKILPSRWGHEGF